MVLTGKAAAGKLTGACAGASLVILADAPGPVPDGCALIDSDDLRLTGPLAVWQDGRGLRIEPTNTGRRLWSPRAGTVDQAALGSLGAALAMPLPGQ
ncbi:MAG: hypothetical protein NTW20_10450 [Rhodobacterales bacterium]|nr:hypothetical protein [Rhodobacterales bacterium]